MRAFVVDDEPLAREELRYLLSKIPGIEVVGEAASGGAALEGVARHRPEVVLLDVQMPGMDGIEVARRLAARDARAQVIFVTAFEEYAVQAFEAAAVDYILKPVDPKRLAAALDRVRARLAAPAEAVTSRALLEEMEGLVRAQAAGGAGKGMRKVAIRKGRRIQLLNPGEVFCFTVKDGVVLALAGDGEGVTSYRTLDDLERDLPSREFFRTSRAFIVNVDRISQIVPVKEGTFELVLSNRTVVPLSRARARKLRKLIPW